MTAEASASDASALVASALAHQTRAVARLVRIFEDSRPGGAVARRAVIGALDEVGVGRGVVLGITGTPGSGKSSLVARVVPALLAGDPDRTVAILAVDPSSQVSGGALLGDRTRVRLPTDEQRVFFRSQATQTDLGGLAPMSFQVCRLLIRLFDVVLVETVGIGQSELDIRHLADHVHLVLQPLGGDEIQYLKAGIIEVPDAFVLNKCDEPTAGRTLQQLRSSLALARPFDPELPPIHMVSARTGSGIDDLVVALESIIAADPSTDAVDRDLHFLRRWVRDEWGRVGLRHLTDRVADDPAWYRRCGDFDLAQREIDSGIRALLADPHGIAGGRP